MENQLRLARETRVLYGVGLGAGVVGIAPFMGAFLTGFQPESESIFPTLSFSVLWSLEPVMMLIADDLMNQASGRQRSPANIAGWVLLATTIAFQVTALAITAGGGPEEIGLGFGIAGAVVFLPMQILTDVLGTRAIHRARRMRSDE